MDARAALDAVSPFLPFGARWYALLWWTAGAALAGWIACSVALWIAGGPLRRLRGADVHWTERTRIGHPAAVTAMVTAMRRRRIGCQPFRVAARDRISGPGAETQTATTAPR